MQWHNGYNLDNLVWCCMVSGSWCMILTLLGPSLKDIHIQLQPSQVQLNSSLNPGGPDGKHWPPCSLCNAALNSGITQISHIEHVHLHHFVHGDTKPTNFLMGVGEHNHEVYLVNFSLAKKFRDPKTHLHIPYKEHCPPTGTGSYVSINDHLDVKWSCCDDIESLAYILLYFLHGSLSWHAIQAATSKQEHNKILQLKMSSTLNFYHACPSEFNIFLAVGLLTKNLTTTTCAASFTSSLYVKGTNMGTNLPSVYWVKTCVTGPLEVEERLGKRLYRRMMYHILWTRCMSTHHSMPVLWSPLVLGNTLKTLTLAATHIHQPLVPLSTISSR